MDRRSQQSQVDSNLIATTALRTLGYLMGAGVVGIVTFGAQASSLWRFFMVVGLGVMVGGTFLLGGGLLGFLFGIPRTQQQENVAYLANTNLEQISDWLTKILVGVGLTQISGLPAALQEIARTIASGVTGFAAVEGFIIALILFYTICGFLFGFLWTRLFFGGALKSADESLRDRMAKIEEEQEEVREGVKSLADQASMDAKALNLVSRQLTRDAPDIGYQQIVETIKAASELAREQIFRRAWSVRADNWSHDTLLMAKTIPIFKALIDAARPQEVSEYHGQLGFALKDKPDPDYEDAREHLTRAIELRGSWVDQGWLYYEFNRAICNIRLDPNLNTNHPAPRDVLDSVRGDLVAFFWLDDLRSRFLAAENIRAWIEKNKIDVASVIAEGKKLADSPIP